jgi:hypothetical protein
MTDSKSDDKQMLTVSSPCTLLNHIAQRYTRTSRIIMEYVDNSLDDAEALYNEKTNSYSRSINILVEINRQKIVEEIELPVKNGVEKVEVPIKSDSNISPGIEGLKINGSPGKSVESDSNKPLKSTKKKVKKAPKPKVTWITEVTVSDNCRGMTKATLNRLIVNVGDSSKRGSKFTNGHFGFGVHAFRACAKRIEFKTKTSEGKTLGLKIDRNNEYFPKPKYIADEAVNSRSGTIVKVSDFDNTWSEQLDSKEIIKEIQHHFSGLLERDNLRVEVKNVARDVLTVCKPFQLSSFKVIKAVEKVLKFENNDVKVRLCVASAAQPGRNCLFVCKGRRVNEVSDVKSFMKMSRCRWAVWGHPNLLGFIDVTQVLEPVITRDEFRLTTTRKNVYRKIVEDVEPVLYKALHEVNENRKIVALAKLEDVVAKCVNAAVKKDIRRDSDGLSYLQQMMLSKKPSRNKKIDEDFDVENTESKKRKRLDDDIDTDKGDDVHPAGGKAEKPNKKRKTGLGFNIAFVKELASEVTGEPCRARLVGEDVQINMKHPDFLTRIKINKNDHKPIVTERLCGYLANVIAAAYKSNKLMRGGGMERYMNDHSRLLDEILDITLSLETHMRSKLKLMQREMETGAQAAAANKIAPPEMAANVAVDA